MDIYYSGYVALYIIDKIKFFLMNKHFMFYLLVFFVYLLFHERFERIYLSYLNGYGILVHRTTAIIMVP